MAVATTELGKFLRKLRIDKEENLGDMAERLGCTSSYLSAIEKGKRPLPEQFVDQIADIYAIDTEARSRLAAAADKTIRSIKVSLNESSDLKREAALVFARSFEDLDDETSQKILNLLKRKHGSADDD